MKYLKYFKESKEDIDYNEPETICESDLTSTIYSATSMISASACRMYNIRNYTINDDETVDVDGDVNLSSIGLTELPLKFRKVSGSFYCTDNQLLSLEGSPLEVGGNFYCYNNQLTSLLGSPEKVGGGFYCDFNKLTSLSGAPREVGSGFFCNNNQLLSLEGISKYISGGIYFNNNQLRDVMGVKDGWSGEISIIRNPVYEIFSLFPRERWDEVIELLNEYNVIRDGKLVILQGLEQIFLEMGLEVPEIDEIEGYDIQF